jgi:membrane-bound lytic murein transglycosylase A
VAKLNWLDIRKSGNIWHKNALIPILISLPVAALAVFAPLQRLGNRPLAPEECQVKKWDVPVSLRPKIPLPQSKPQSKPQITATKEQKIAPVLVPRPPVSCCPGDLSCMDGAIFEGVNNQPADRKALLTSLDRSLGYLQTEGASLEYKDYPIPGITRERVIKSLQRFRQLLLNTKSTKELHAAIQKEFVLYQSVGSNGQGRVLFTAYFEPVYTASRVRTAEFRYPIYKLPPDLESWPRPHPKRIDLEGADALQGSKGKLKGLEFFWFRDRLEPYMMQIQGSSQLQLTDGSKTTVGYAGAIRQDYKSIGKELINDGKIPKVGSTMPDILNHFKKYPQDLNIYIPRDPSFVFFREKHGEPAHGSIGVPVTADRSIATDKKLMPPGALAFIRAPFPLVNSKGEMEHNTISRFVLDQDAGGAIKGPSRVDYFVGTGKIAGERAGATVAVGQLYYLLLK